MQFSVNTQELTEAVVMVTKAMPAHGGLPILEGIYIDASENRLFMKCSDLSLQIETEIPAIVEEEGSCVIPGRFFADLSRRFTYDRIDFSSEKNTMKIRSGRVKTSIQVNNSKDFPEMVRVNDVFTANVAQNVLRAMIKQVLFSASTEDTKAILMGALLRFKEDKLIMVALDGYRLAIRTEKIINCTGERSAVIPSRALQEISNILSESGDGIKLAFSTTHIKITFGNTSIISRLLDGEYVNYENILPSNFAVKATVNKKELKDSVERALLMARESKSNLIKMSFSQDTLEITANSELGNINEEIEINLVGKELDIAFNARYILDILKSIDDEEIILCMNNSVTPCVVLPADGESYYYMVLPVRMFSGA